MLIGVYGYYGMASFCKEAIPFIKLIYRYKTKSLVKNDKKK